MFSKMAVGQLAGFLFLFVLVTSIVSQFMAGDPIDANDVSKTLTAVAQGGAKFRLSIAIDLASHVSIIALAGVLYLTFSRHNQILALLGMLWRLGECTIIASTELVNILLLGVGQKFVSAAGAEAGALEMMGRTLIMAEESGYRIGLTFFALGSLMFAILFVTSRAVPLPLGWWGIIASLSASIGIWITLINPNVSVQGHTLFTFNTRDYAALQPRYLSQQRPHAGSIVSDQPNVGLIVRRLLNLLDAKSAKAMHNRLEFLSNWR